MTEATHEHAGGYRHEAFLYACDEQFVAGVLDFIGEAIVADEPILVVLSADKIAALQRELRGERAGVLFADMAEVGANPARIIPAWQGFVDTHAAPERRLRGIGEPIWAGRSAAELSECQRHEALLNVVFDDPAFWLLCPYDTGALDAAVIAEARRTHPFIRDGSLQRASATYPGAQALSAPFTEPLTDAPADAATLAFGPLDLREVRQFASAYAQGAGLGDDGVFDLALAVGEITANSVMHGGGYGTMRMWHDAHSVICEVSDDGHVDDPLADRRRPDGSSERGRGLWIANHACDLVQLRSFASGSVVRLHKRLLHV